MKYSLTQTKIHQQAEPKNPVTKMVQNIKVIV